jgi:hypothetical protein
MPVRLTVDNMPVRVRYTGIKGAMKWLSDLKNYP